MRKLLLLLSVISLLFASCKKDSETGNTTVSVLLTDAPANYDAVNVDIQGVEITGPGGKATLLNINPGIYNLLDFANGADTLIATGNLEAGKVSQIRLILGINNSVVVDSIAYPLTTPSAQQSGLKLQLHNTFTAGVAYMLLLDFDASQSVVETGNGEYQLKPVIRVADTAISGSIKGKINPPGVFCSITAAGSAGNFSTVSDTNGNFLVQGVPAGLYDVTISPAAPFLPVTVNNVTVVTGQVSDLGIINF